jgi:acyl-coenzyme A thioesterase PaaI-like protein
VSEAAPGIPDSAAFATPERAEFASAIRSLIDAAMSAEDVAPETLRALSKDVEQLTFRLGRGRAEGAGYTPRGHGDYLPRSPIVGDASPLSPRFDWEIYERDAGESGRDESGRGAIGVEARGTFGAPYEGPPGYVHGGWVACTFDEILGIANIASGSPGMTGRLVVHYRRPTPLFREIRVRAWVDRLEGRRIMSRAEMYDGETLTAEAEGLFVQPRPELAEQYFGRPFGPPD